MEKKLIIPKDHLKAAIHELVRAGHDKREGFTLFLGDLRKVPLQVTEVYTPQYESGALYYKITTEGDTNLYAYLKMKRLMVIAQIHSHPKEAFHSAADDKMATVEYVGGLSFVLPDFGLGTTPENFSKLVSAFQLRSGGVWKDAPASSWEVV